MREWILSRNAVAETLRARRRDFFRLWVAEGLPEQSRLEDIFRLATACKLRLERVPRHKLDALGAGHQGVALEASYYPYSALPDMLELAAERREPPFLLILDILQDPQNLGVLLRTAEAVGVHGILLPFRRTATVTPAVVNTSSGATEHLLIAQTNLAQAIGTLKEQGVWVAGLEGSPQAQPIDQVRLDGPLALVVGGEGEGMRPLTRRSCDVLVSLPMRGHIQSLNAAVAASVALYFAWKGRGWSSQLDDLAET